VKRLEKLRARMSVTGSRSSPIAEDESTDDISIIPLEELLGDEFVDEDLDLAKSDPTQHTLFKNAFRSALQCIYSPYYTQLEKNLDMDDATFFHADNIDDSDGSGAATPVSSG